MSTVSLYCLLIFFFFQAEDGIRDYKVTGVQTCALPIFKGGLWVQGGGPLAGMEFGTLLWLSTIALSTIGSGVWYDKVRPLLKATFWAWLVRVNGAGLIVGFLVK